MEEVKIISIPAHQIAQVFSDTGNYWEIESCEATYRFAIPKIQTDCLWCNNG